MRKLTSAQFAAYANRQIATATAIQRGHYPAGGCYCSCGRQLPCSVAESCQRTITHFEGKLALLDSTVALPVVPSSPSPGRTQWRRWSRLLAAGLL